MGMHPNTILMVALTPAGLSRKTMRDILDELGNVEGDDTVMIGGVEYRHRVMEDPYDAKCQIKSNEGDLLFFDLVTYGYGKSITWEELERQKTVLEEWAKGVCERHACAYEIRVSANFW